MVSPTKVEDIVAKLAEPFLLQKKLELVEVEFKKEGSNYYLRVFIDKPGGVGLDDCEAVSRFLSDKLDETDPIPQSYMLEVSSPGIERPLKKPGDFTRFKGHGITIQTFAPVNGEKRFVGKLVGIVDDQIVINRNGQEVSVPRKSAASVRLSIEDEKIK